jgi:hypothetical protein
MPDTARRRTALVNRTCGAILLDCGLSDRADRDQALLVAITTAPSWKCAPSFISTLLAGGQRPSPRPTSSGGPRRAAPNGASEEPTTPPPGEFAKSQHWV